MKKENLFLWALTISLLVPSLALGAGHAITKPIIITPGARNTRIIIRNSGDDESVSESPEVEAKRVVNDGIIHWGRPAAGLWLSLTNAGALNAPLHVTEDKILMGHASEFGFGVGGMMDVPVPGSDHTQSMRFKVGIQHMSITPDSSVQQDYSSAQLEGSTNLFHFSGIYRVAPAIDTGFGIFWYGGGVIINHVYDSGFPTEGAAGVATKLRGSYGINFAAAAGIEMPFTDSQDAGIEVQWQPVMGFSMQLSVRTSL